MKVLLLLVVLMSVFGCEITPSDINGNDSLNVRIDTLVIHDTIIEYDSVKVK